MFKGFNKKPSGNRRDDRGGRGGYGGGNSWNRGGDRDARPSMHRATCAECNSSCEVPFKPNGRKPVLCSNCFRGESGGGEKGLRFNNRSERSDRSNSYEKPPYKSTPRGGSEELSKQIRVLDKKVDQILEILMSLEDEEEEMDDAEFVDEAESEETES